MQNSMENLVKAAIKDLVAEKEKTHPFRYGYFQEKGKPLYRGRSSSRGSSKPAKLINMGKGTLLLVLERDAFDMFYTCIIKVPSLYTLIKDQCKIKLSFKGYELLKQDFIVYEDWDAGRELLKLVKIHDLTIKCGKVDFENHSYAIETLNVGHSQLELTRFIRSMSRSQESLVGGTIWFTDGSWAKEDYDGFDYPCWNYYTVPEIPKELLVN
jgi:hypothetical protein